MTTDSLFHMTVEDVFSIARRGTVVTGKIDAGTIHVGDEIIIRGRFGDKKATVAGIEVFKKILEQAGQGEGVGILLKDVDKRDVQKGDQLASPGMDFSWQQ